MTKDSPDSSPECPSCNNGEAGNPKNPYGLCDVCSRHFERDYIDGSVNKPMELIMKNTIKPPIWKRRGDNLPPPDTRVLAFSSCYPKGHDMRWRMLSSQFLRLCSEVDLWTECEQLLPSDFKERRED